MAFDDLRSFIRCLEENDLIRHVRKEVDWNLEIGAVVHETFQRHGPALLFDNVKDSDYPLLAGALMTTERLGLALGTPNDCRAMQKKGFEALMHPLEPELISDGACQQNVVTGDDIDLARFPTPFWHPLDGGRFIGTLGVVITKDPDTGAQNAALYRQQVLGKKKTGALLGRHAAMMFQKYAAADKPMPIATCFGVPPALLACAPMPLNYGENEMGVAGALIGKPLPVVRGKTVDLLVPANCEFVLEGYISTDEVGWEEEGPFGEYTGYYGGERLVRPTIELSAITHRDNPILQGTLEGKAPNESETISTFAHSLGMKSDLVKMGVPGIKDVWNRSRGFFTCVSLERQFYAGHARQVIDALLTVSRGTKYIIVVDSDIDVFNAEDVDWAIATRVQPHRDIVITDNQRLGMVLDPSIQPDMRAHWLDVRTSKMGIDATTKYKGHEFPPTVEPDAQAHARVLEHWHEYGIDTEPVESIPVAGRS